MAQRLREWSSALTVMVITVVLVVLDVSETSVHRYWSRHSFTSSVLSGLLVLLLTVLIVDRVARLRQLRNESRAIAAQAAVIVGQASRTADAVAGATAGEHEEASAELRTYTQMLLTSTPVLIDAKGPRAFLETAERVAYQLIRALQDEPGQAQKKRLDAAVQQLRDAGAPLLAVLNREQLTAVSSEEETGEG